MQTRTSLVGALALTAALGLAGQAGAQTTAQPAASVLNAGQAFQPFAPSQPNAALTARGSCDHALTADEAARDASTCSAAGWPALRADWGATLPVAGGDVLKLSIPGDSTTVGASIVDLSPPPAPVADPPPVVVPASRERTREAAAPAPPTLELPSLAKGDDGLWRLELPSGPRVGFGPFDLAVAAHTPDGDHTYTARLTAGRKGDPDRCGAVFYLPTLSFTDCPVAPPGGGLQTPPTTVVPPPVPAPIAAAPAAVAAQVTLKAAGQQRLGRLRFTATANTKGCYRVRVSVGSVRLSRVVTVQQAGSVTFRLQTTARQNQRLRRALKRGRVTVKATITGAGTTATATTVALRK